MLSVRLIEEELQKLLYEEENETKMSYFSLQEDNSQKSDKVTYTNLTSQKLVTSSFKGVLEM